MAPPLCPFVDHYAVLGCSPGTSVAELKHAYFEKIRKYHPDKRPDTPHGRGQKVAQALNVAWEVLGDPCKRDAYDIIWHKENESANPSPEAQADKYRHEGNELYKIARTLEEQYGPDSPDGASKALQKYQAAICKYSLGIEFAPQDYRLRSNRALCYAALKDWPKCREDALYVTQLKPELMQGWFLYVKSLWKEGSPAAAQRELVVALKILPRNAELIALQTDIKERFEEKHQSHLDGLPQIPRGRRASWSGSLICTPTDSSSRVPTPPTIRKPMPPSATSQIPGPSRPSRARQQSRSPGPCSRQQSQSPDPKFLAQNNAAQLGEPTANFGAEIRSSSRSRPWADPIEAQNIRHSTPPRSRGVLDLLTAASRFAGR